MNVGRAFDGCAVERPLKQVSSRFSKLVLFFMCVALDAVVQPAQASPPETSNPPTVKVTKDPFRVTVEFKGTFEARHAHELAIAPKAWSQPMKIQSIVPHGTMVKKGDLVLQVDTEKLDRAIESLRMELEVTELALALADRELPIAERMYPLELDEAERGKRIADEDLRRFLETELPLAKESSLFSVRASEEYLKYAREELRQLEKMYQDKDLTEETEEMILQRQRFQVEQFEFFLRMSRVYSERRLTLDLPRQETSMRQNALKQELQLQKARETLALQVDQKRVALRKQRFDFEENTRKLEDYRDDRASFSVTAPADGILYYGRLLDGNWTTAATAQKLVTGGELTPSEVFATVVEPQPLIIHAKLEEKDLHWVRAGLEGKVVAAGYPDLRMPARLVEILPVPKGGQFDVRVEVEFPRNAPQITPAMSCTMWFMVYDNPESLTVPSTAVFSDDGGETHYVYRRGVEDRPQRHGIQVGRAWSGRTEVVDGLSEGDEILTSKP